MRQSMILAAAALFLFGATGCATLTRGDKQTMKLNSEPQGATVTLNDGKAEQKVVTPAEVKLKRKDKYQVAVTKEGYRPVQFELVAKWDGAALANAPIVALPGGSLSVAADRKTGADLQFYKLETIKLQPATAAETGTVKLTQYRGKLLTEEQYKKVMEEEAQYRKDFQGAN